MAITGFLDMSMYSHYDSQYIPSFPASSLLITGASGCLSDRVQIFRIYKLTGSRLKTGLVFAFSFVAFILGVVSTAIGFVSGVAHPLERITGVIWHALQAIAEFLIMCTSFYNLFVVKLNILHRLPFASAPGFP
jgi:hypothetical protein